MNVVKRETLEERITRLESIIEQNNLITVDAVLGVYDELVTLREEIAGSKGTNDNAKSAVDENKI